MNRFVLVSFLLLYSLSSSATDYYSFAPGFANDLNNWRTVPGGVPATSFTATGDKFIIQNGHTMTTNGNWLIGSATSTLQIQSGGILQGNHWIQFTGAFQIDDGGKYIHNNTGPVLAAPGNSIWGGAESFASNSNVEIQNWPGGTTGFVTGITWGNLIVNLKVNLGTNWNWNFADGTTIDILGNFEVQSTYLNITCELDLTPSGTHFINVGGNFLLSGTTTQVKMKRSITTVPSLSGYTTMQVNGDISVTGTALLHTGDQSSTVPVKGLYDLRFKGNFSAIAGAAVTATGLSSYLVANGVAQTFNCAPTIDCGFRVAAGSTLSLISPFSSSTSSVVNVAGTLNQNFNAMTVLSTFEIAGGIFNSNGPLTIGFSCVPCTGDGTYNGVNATWCTLTGVRGTVNFNNNNAITLKNDVVNSFLGAGALSGINSPGDVYFVNSVATDLGSAHLSGYATGIGSIFSLDENSYVAGGTQSVYYGRGGTLRIASTNGITAFPDVTGNVRTQSRNYDNSGVNNFEYFGSSQQAAGDGLPISIQGFLKINNSAGIGTSGVTLSQNTTITGTLDLTLGKLTSTPSQVLTLANDAVAINYSTVTNNSFVSGPMQKIGEEDFEFPIGEGAEMHTIKLLNQPGNNPADEFRIQYYKANPQVAYPGATAAPGTDHMSAREYWDVFPFSGGISKQVVLQATTYSNATDLTKLVIIHLPDPFTAWLNDGNFAVSGGGSAGFVTSNVVASTGGAFTFASTDPYPVNPLPVNLITFDATKLSTTKSSIDWELAACCSSAAKFEVQRANADKSFGTIGIIGGNETSKIYNYIDNGLKKGVNYYRLKMIDADGKITYSRVVAIMNGVDGLLLTSLVPTIINNSATLTISSSSAQKIELMIVDMQGRIMQRQNYSLSAGNTSIEINTDRLGAGIYQLFGVTTAGRTNLIRFIKQ